MTGGMPYGGGIMKRLIIAMVIVALGVSWASTTEG
jgi:hypothetical protein